MTGQRAWMASHCGAAVAGVRSDDCRFQLLVDPNNGWAYELNGRLTEMEPGELLFADLPGADAVEATRLVAQPRYQLGFSARWASTWLKDADRMVGQKISGPGWGGVLAEFVAQLTPTSSLSVRGNREIVADHLGTLLRIVEAEMFECRIEPDVDLNPVARICEAIRQRCTEISLSACEIARSLEISERSLHRYLQSAGMRFGNHLMQCRIACARKMLELTNFRSLTTSEIGLRAGFGDPCHFARVMRTSVGHSPDAYRHEYFNSTESSTIHDALAGGFNAEPT